MAGDDRLSTLSDDLLRRVLYFVPTKDAASTSVLSRRWVDLWRSSGAVNLVARVRHDNIGSYSSLSLEEAEEAFFSRRDAFVSGAEAALARADAPVSRLSVQLEAEHDEWVLDRFLHGNRDRRGPKSDVVGALVSHRAARRVEELRVAVAVAACRWSSSLREIYALRSLPSSETLRVLDLTGCEGLELFKAAAFPRLATLRLRLCTVRAEYLQALLDAAPVLATVNLDSVSIDPGDSTTAGPTAVHLGFPVTTALSLEWCDAIEVDAPQLQCFRYTGTKRELSMASPCPDLDRVDLRLHDDRREPSDKYARYRDKECKHFWQLVQNFTAAKTLKLKVDRLEYIAVTSAKKQAEHLCQFPSVRHLELEGVYSPTRQTAAAATIANLLHCCPVLAEIKLELSTTLLFDAHKDSRYGELFLEQKEQFDYNKSIDRFIMRHTSKPMTPLDDGSGGNNCDGVPDIPGLSGKSFQCLQSSMRRVGLKFRLDKTNCLEVQLLKFFAGNAVVLQEMCVDCGNRRLNEHMNLAVERWVDSSRASFKGKNLAESSWEFSKCPTVSLDSTTDLPRNAAWFTVVPLRS